jgi:hypothetical protein
LEIEVKKVAIRDFALEMADLKFQILDLKDEIDKLRGEISDLRFQIWEQKVRGSDLEISRGKNSGG